MSLKKKMGEEYKKGRDAGLTLSRAIANECKTLEEFKRKLENEYRMRKRYKIDTNLSLQELYDASANMRRFINEAQILLWIATLSDEFGFGEKRLNRAMDRFIMKHESINDGYASWMDYTEAMEEKLKKKLKFAMLMGEMREDGKI